MAHDRETLGILDVWREMPPDERQAAAAALWQDPDSVSQQVEAIHAIAKQYNFRPQSVLKLPADRRARHLSVMARVPESVAGRALVAYHLTDRRAMLETFLDALGMAHKGGVIEETPDRPPDQARLKAAVDAISAVFPAAAVRLYLRTLAAQDPDAWHGLLALTPPLSS